MNIYKELILDHSRSPQNFRAMSKVTAKATVENQLCGDELTFYLLVKSRIVVDCSFSGVGCAISKAGASLLSEYVKGKSVNKLRRLTKDSMINLLGIELGPVRIKCGLLPLEALHKALQLL